MPEKLDPQRIKELLRKADDRWHIYHPGQYKYEEHLDFVSSYLARHYHRKK